MKSSLITWNGGDETILSEKKESVAGQSFISTVAVVCVCFEINYGYPRQLERGYLFSFPIVTTIKAAIVVTTVAVIKPRTPPLGSCM